MFPRKCPNRLQHGHDGICDLNRLYLAGWLPGGTVVDMHGFPLNAIRSKAACRKRAYASYDIGCFVDVVALYLIQLFIQSTAPTGRASYLTVPYSVPTIR